MLPRGHRLDGRHGVRAADLAAETFLAREPGSGTRILMSRYLDRIGEGLEFQTVEMDRNETIKQAVMAGLGIAFMSLHTAVEELRAGRLRLLDAPGLPIERTWYLVSLRPGGLSPLARRMAHEIAARASDLPPRLEVARKTAGRPAARPGRAACTEVAPVGRKHNGLVDAAGSVRCFPRRSRPPDRGIPR